MKKIIRNIIATILTILIVILGYFVIANIVATNNNTIASFFGISISYVPTQSMEPTISSGSTIMFEQNTKYSSLKTGDIIVYHNDETNMYVIHRIKSSDTNGFIMQGDNNNSPDYYQGTTNYYYVTENNYVGKYIATVSAFSITSSLSRTLIMVIALSTFLLVVASEGVSIYKNINKNKKANEPLVSDSEKEKMKEELLKEIKEELENEQKKN